MAGLYIHIPFCESRCIYCGFYSTTSLKRRDAYVDALCKEMKLRPWATELGTEMETEMGTNHPIQTIYLGGGTPSQLSSEQLIRLFEGIRLYISEERRVKSQESEERREKSEETKFGGQRESQFSCNTNRYEGTDDCFEGMEITMECNPDDVTDDFCETLRKLPVNRISMGAQTFSDERLCFLHRRHNTAEVKDAVTRLRNIGIGNISIDLMFGFPEETLEDWASDIQQAIDLNVEHISAYSLMYEEGTSLYRMLEQKKVQEIDEELSRNMYEMLIDKLTAAGYNHYEISNFAKLGFHSRHNSSYWHEVPYIGLGAAAHSYRRKILPNGAIEATRSWNIDNIQEYMASINNGILPSQEEKLDLDTRYNDLITTALRTSQGIDLQRMKKEFGKKYLQQLLQEAKGKIKRGWMKLSEDMQYISLTREGIYISDDIMSDFMIV